MGVGRGLSCRRRWTCCATRGCSGRCCCHATSTGRSTKAFTSWDPPAAGARGEGCVHPHGVVPPPGRIGRCLEVAARPPGAQLSSMLGYVHDIDFYSAWTELVILGRFEPPARQFAAGTAYLRGKGEAGSALCTGSRRCRGRSGTSSSRPNCQPGQPAASDDLGEGLSSSATPTPTSSGTPCSAHRWSPRGARGGPMNVVMLSPGYPAEMAFFTRALAAVGARVIGVGDRRRTRCPPRPGRRSPTTSTFPSPTRERCSRRCTAWPATPGRPGGVPLGAVSVLAARIMRRSGSLA